MSSRRLQIKLGLRPWYLARPRLWREDLGLIDTRSMISRRWEYVYLRVPKAANSTVLRTLVDHYPEPDDADTGDIDRYKTRAAHFRSVMPWEMGRVQRFFTFTVVRDPYARVLSAWLDKFRVGDKHRERFGCRVAGYDGGRLSFSGFCRYLADGGEGENAHWMRQVRFACMADRLDFVGRVETLEADLAVVLARIGGRAVGEVRRTGPPATGADERLAGHYDAECREIVARVYAEDFERFGYPV